MRLILLLLCIVAAGGCDRQKPPSQQGGADVGQPSKGVDRSKAGTPAPDVLIFDAEGEEATLTQLQGKPVLVNLWASWCAPCVKELPSLQALAKRPGAPRVIAVSQDMAPRASVDAFLDRLGLDELEAWHDPEMAISTRLGAQILPTSILYDAQGREVWRFVGDLDWTGDEAAELLAAAR